MDRHGYGKFRTVLDGTRRTTGAHRAAFLAFKGDIEGDLVIDHLCRNRSCVNPDHLWLGSNADNVADKIAKGDRIGVGDKVLAIAGVVDLNWHLGTSRANVRSRTGRLAGPGSGRPSPMRCRSTSPRVGKKRYGSSMRCSNPSP